MHMSDMRVKKEVLNDHDRYPCNMTFQRSLQANF